MSGKTSTTSTANGCPLLVVGVSASLVHMYLHQRQAATTIRKSLLDLNQACVNVFTGACQARQAVDHTIKVFYGQ